MTPEVLHLEAGERGEIVLYPEGDVCDPCLAIDGPDEFVVEDVLFDERPAPSVSVSDTPRGTWSASVRGVAASPERPVKVLVRNAGECKISLRATIG